MGDKKKHYEKPLAIDASFEEAFKILVKEDKEPVSFLFENNLSGMDKIIIQMTEPDVDFENNSTTIYVFVNGGKRSEIDTKQHILSNNYKQKTVIHIPIPKGTHKMRISIAQTKQYDVRKLSVIAANNDL
jgi:hypothetical protein